MILLPVLALAVYLFAALVTLPPLGGAVVETGQRAITVEADDGRVFATRGSFRGQKLTAADLPEERFVAIKDDVVNAGGVWIDAAVACDRNIITSRTPHDLTPFCQAIIEATK